MAAHVGDRGLDAGRRRLPVGGAVGLRDNIKIGNRAVIGASSGVHRDVKDGEVVLGTPIPADQGILARGRNARAAARDDETVKAVERKLVQAAPKQADGE